MVVVLGYQRVWSQNRRSARRHGKAPIGRAQRRLSALLGKRGQALIQQDAGGVRGIDNDRQRTLALCTGAFDMVSTENGPNCAA